MHYTGMVSFSTPSQAREMARILLEKKLAACTQVIASVESAYWWKGKIERDRETILVFKTTAKKIGAAIKEIEKNHCYEVPVIEAWPAQKTNARAAKWMERELK